MSDLISQAENALLRPADLTPDAVASVLGTLVAAPGVDAADLYFQHASKVTVQYVKRLGYNLLLSVFHRLM